jgi:hypothetical protein
LQLIPHQHNAVTSWHFCPCLPCCEVFQDATSSATQRKPYVSNVARCFRMRLAQPHKETPMFQMSDRLCGPVVRVPGYRSEVLVRFPALPDFLTSSGSGTGSTQPREYNWRTTWKRK